MTKLENMTKAQLIARVEELENPKSVPVGCSCHHVDFYGADATKIHEQEVKEAFELRGFW